MSSPLEVPRLTNALVSSLTGVVHRFDGLNYSFLGNAVCVSPDLAVTALSPLLLEALGSPNSIRLRSEGVSDTSAATIVATDANVGFAVLKVPRDLRKTSLSPSAPFRVNIPSDLFQIVLPAPDSECTIYFRTHETGDEGRRMQGRVMPGEPGSFGIETSDDTWIVPAGAPVIVERRLLGIVAAIRQRPSSDHLSVITFGAMAESRETGLVRRVMAPDPPLTHFGPSAREALERADGMRRVSGVDKVHIEHLIAGLFEELDGPAQRLFRAAEVDQPTLFKIIEDTVGTIIPATYSATDLQVLPLMSTHAQAAMQAAVQLANEEGSATILSRHLLSGVFSIDRSVIVRAILERGVRTDNIDKEGHEDVDEKARRLLMERRSEKVAALSEPQKASRGANPAPKLDSDIWAKRDRLGYEAYARTIASLITNKYTEPPLTIGIKAPWGAGKTSLMKRVQHLLDGDAKVTEQNETGSRHLQQTSEMTLSQVLKELKTTVVPDTLKATIGDYGKMYNLPPRITVWFNAWKHQTSEQVWAGMAHCIISQITARMDSRQRELFWLRLNAKRINADEVRWKIYESVLRYISPLLVISLAFILLTFVFSMPFYSRLLLTALSLTPAVIGAARKFGDKAAGAVRELIREPNYEGRMGYLYLVESDIRDVLDLASITKETPLVIFVDDLDRCVPRKVAEVVEAINLFLCGDYPNCIFVLGMEPGMVAAALEVANEAVIAKAQEMALLDSTVPVGWRFMEKIVQLPVIIPPATQADLEGYVKSLTADLQSDGVAQANERPVPSREAINSQTEIVDPGAEATVQNWVEQFRSPANVDEVIRISDELIGQAPPDERWAAAEASKRVFEKAYTDRDPAVSGFVNEIVHLVGGNPRQIKRYVNVFRFYSTLRHSLRVDAAARCIAMNFPTDAVMAKFVALSIIWPQAVGYLRTSDIKARAKDSAGRSLLSILEEKSRSMTVDDERADNEWMEFVEENGASVGKWIGTRSFRQFLARGEPLCQSEGHGLW
jgi:hypothetical protein